jgi:hypothetical protein
MLQSSIFGKEFINYRKSTIEEERNDFSKKTRSKGIGCVPIVVDSVDKELGLLLAKKDVKNPRNIRYGLELILHMDLKVVDLIEVIKREISSRNNIDVNDTNIVIGLEDGTLPETNKELGILYKENRNIDDNILYVIITRETTVYGYIISILKYLANYLHW